MACELPPAEQPSLKLGYLTLVDSAPLIAAQALGLFRALDLEVTLHLEVSWANLRDKLIAGHFDGVHMLAPLPAMAALGASGLRVPLITGLLLSRNGNAITVSKHQKPSQTQQQKIRRAADRTHQAFLNAEALAARLKEASKPLTFGVVHTFSSHMLLLRRWLRLGGIDPDRDVRFIVVPPSQMPDSLSEGLIDGFCAGEPWNSIAVERGCGYIAACGVDVWRDAPEKLLCVTEHWHNAKPATHARLRLALLSANHWLTQPANRRAMAEVLAHKDYLDLPSAMLLPALTGNLQIGSLQSEPQARVNDYLIFNPRIAGRPDAALAEQLLQECSKLIGKEIAPQTVETLIRSTFRSDLFDETYEYWAQLPDTSILRQPILDNDLSGVSQKLR
ncbi:MAG: CmpA/NrtA family ABC transporter substrate-binding protein [Pseudomonadota bacterium]